MSRVTTIITGPDGKVTTVVTRRSGCGCLTFLAAVVVFFLPATFGAWAIPAYIFLGILVVAAVASSLRKNMHRAAPKPPPVAAPPP